MRIDKLILEDRYDYLKQKDSALIKLLEYFTDNVNSFNKSTTNPIQEEIDYALDTHNIFIKSYDTDDGSLLMERCYKGYLLDGKLRIAWIVRNGDRKLGSSGNIAYSDFIFS